MSDEVQGSITRWIGDLQDGGDVNEALEQLWDRYFDKLVHLARANCERRTAVRPMRKT